MTRLEALRRANPALDVYSVCDEEFLKYGRVVDADTEEFVRLVKENQVMPEKGSAYVPEFPAIETSRQAEVYRNTVAGQMDYQWGLCWGFNRKMTALEWHTCNEFNIGVTDLILILGKRSDIDRDGTYDSAKCEFFYLPEGVMIETYADTLHYGPCMVSEDGFSMVVGLQRGTNTPLDPGTEHDALLHDRNKWLMAHEEETELIKSGVPGLVYGENWEVNTIG